MPTVIDELIVLLELDPKNFTAGQKKASADFLKTRDQAAAVAKDVEARGKQAAEFFGKMRGEALKLFTLFTAGVGIKDFVTGTINAEVAVGQLSKQIGISTEALGAWQQVAKRNGGTAESITGTLKGLSQQFEQIKLTGDSPNAGILYQLGMRPEDFEDAEKAFLKLSDALAKKSPKEAAFYANQLGIDPATLDLMRRGSADLQKQLADAKARGVPGDDDVKAAQALKNEIEDLKQASDRLGQEMLTQLAPAIETITGDLRGLAAQVHDGGFSQFSKEMGTTAHDAAELGTSVGGLVKTVGDFLGVLNRLGSGGGGPTQFERMLHSLDDMIQAVTHSVRGLIALMHGDLKTAAMEGQSSFIYSQRALGTLPDPRDGARARPGPPGGAAPGAPLGPVSANLDAAVRTLIGEARKGDTTGQGDVAHVILNRMDRTGKSAGDVVHAKGQFEPWMTEAGRARLAAIRTDSPEYRAALDAWTKAVREKAAGIDPTKGATLFVAPAAQRALGRKMPAWARDDRRTLERGGHQFYTGAFPGDRGAKGAQGAQTGARAVAPVTTVQQQTNSVTIGRIEINTAATDAKGVARDLRPALMSAGNLATQANSGIQ